MITVKDMEMPTSCNNCRFIVPSIFHRATCYLTDKPIGNCECRPGSCPLKEIPNNIVDKYHELKDKYPDIETYAILPFAKRQQ